MTSRQIGLLLVLCGAVFLEGLDVAMLNVAVPEIAQDLHLAPSAAHWVISAYVLGYAGFMLLGGRTADLVGKRRVFCWAMAAFIAFSLLGGIATHSWMLIVARFVTGVAAGFMTPAGFAIVSSSFPEGPSRNRALSIYGAVGGAGFALGMVFGGLLTSIDWRWVFFGPAVVGAPILILARRLIRPDPQRPARQGQFDLAGALSITAGMVALVYAVVTFGEGGKPLLASAALVLGAGSLACFWRVETVAANPLVRLSVLTSGMLPQVAVAGMLFMGSYFGYQLVITLFLQDYLGWSALVTGLVFAVMGADLILGPVLAPRLSSRWGNPAVMTLGLVAIAASQIMMLRVGSDWNYWNLLPSLLLVALAFALVYGPLTSAATMGLADDEHGLAGGVVNTAFQFGAALGLALVSIAISKGSDGEALSDYRNGFAVAVAMSLIGVLVGVAVTIRARRRITPG
ncbi:MFS transporter [Dermacoccaceae bacterium W4C1]